MTALLGRDGYMADSCTEGATAAMQDRQPGRPRATLWCDAMRSPWRAAARDPREGEPWLARGCGAKAYERLWPAEAIGVTSTKGAVARQAVSAC